MARDAVDENYKRSCARAVATKAFVQLLVQAIAFSDDPSVSSDCAKILIRFYENADASRNYSELLKRRVWESAWERDIVAFSSLPRSTRDDFREDGVARDFCDAVLNYPLQKFFSVGPRRDDDENV